MDRSLDCVNEHVIARSHRDGSAPGERMHNAQAIDPDDCPRGLGRAVVELTLLLPNQQLEALKSAANRQEMTVGQLLRHLIRDSLASLDEMAR